MDRDHVPAWLITLVVLFGLTAAGSFGTFIWYHAQLNALREQRDRISSRILPDLGERRGHLIDLKPQIEEQIELRQVKLQELKDVDEDEMATVQGILGPKHDQALARIEEVLQNRFAEFQTQLANVERARLELGQVEEQALVNERNAQDVRLDLRRKVEERKRELEQKRREHRSQLLVLEKDVKERRERVEELLDRRDFKTEELISDGQILQSNVLDGFVVIDLGFDHDLRKGMRFDVYNRRGGKNRIKGEIEVIEVEQRISTARVLEEVDENDPLIPGDHLHNAIYNPDEQKIYVIAGDLFRFTKPEIAKMIEEAGGKVEPEITRQTHFLVAGENADEALEQASLNGVTVLSENDLIEQIDRALRFQIRQGMVFALAGRFDEIDTSVIKKFVLANGGVLASEVTDGVHALIAGSGDDAARAISEARLIGATVINQRQLQHLMDNSPRDPTK